MGSSPAARASMRERETSMRAMASGERWTSTRPRATAQTSAIVSRAPSSWRGMSVFLLACRDELFDVDQFGRVIAGVAGVAIFVLLVIVHGIAERREREVGKAVGFDEAADLLDAVVGGDQLGAGRGVDAIEARGDGGWAGDAEVHLAGAGLADHADNLAAGGAADDGVVDQ